MKQTLGDTVQKMGRTVHLPMEIQIKGHQYMIFERFKWVATFL